ncbi:MAG: PAS-domain containing protein [Rhodoferax sp.]
MAVHEHGSTETEQLALIQQLGRIGYWEFDPTQRRFFLPQPSLDLLSSMIGRSFVATSPLRDLMIDAERRRLKTALEQAVAQRLNLNLELQLQSPSSEAPTLLIRGRPLERNGQTRLVGTFTDITREKRVESEREEVLNQMHAVIKGLPIGVTVFDEDLRLLFWNDHIYDILGLPQGAVYKFVRFEELIGYPARRGEYGPGDPVQLVAQRAELARKFEPHRFERAARDGRTLLVDGYPFRFGGRVSGFVTTYTDITEQRHNADQVERQHQVLKTILDNFPGAISLFDGSLRMAACNAQLKKMLEFPDELIDRPAVYFEDLIRFNVARGEYGPGVPEEQVATALERARDFQPHHIERTRPNGSSLEIIGAPIPGGGFVTLYIDITERKRAEERIRNMALCDALTGLPNRISINERIDQALQHGAKAHERFALLFLDLDGFKKVNDDLGHDVGDALLQGVAERLKAAVRETDTAARLGGDEFVVLLRDIEGPSAAERIAQTLIDTISQPFALGAHCARVGTSIGMALYPDHGSSRELLLKAADGAMYRAKAGGRGTWQVAA